MPEAIGVNPTTGYIYVANCGDNTVSVISQTTVIATLPTGRWPNTVGVNPVTGYVYVTNWTSDTVTILKETQVITTVPVAHSPQAIDVNPVTGYVYVGGINSSNVTVLSGTNTIATLSVGGNPKAIGVNPNTGYVYVVHYPSDGTGLTVISGTQVVTSLLPTEASIYNLDVGVNTVNNYVYVLNGSTLSVITGTNVITSEPVSYSAAVVGVNSATGYAYLTNQASAGNVTVFSGTQMIDTIPVGDRPQAIAVNPTTGYIYVGNWGSNNVTVLLEAQDVTTLTGGVSPISVKTNPVTGLSYVLEAGINQVAVLSGTQVLTTLSTTGNVWSVDFNPKTGLVYVANQYGDVTIITGTQIITSIPTNALPPIVKVNPNTGYVYVTEPGFSSNGIKIISGTNVITTVNLSSSPRGLAVNPSTGYVYAPSDSGYIFVLSGTHFVANTSVGTEPAIEVNPASGYVYAAWGNWYLSVISETTTIINEVEIGGHVSAIKANPTTGYVYVANQSRNSVTVLSGTQVVMTQPVGLAPTSIAIDEIRGYVYVANQGSNDVTVLSGTDVLDSIPVGKGPRYIDVNQANGLVYVANYVDQSVSVIVEGILANFSASPLSGFRPLTVTFTDQSAGEIISRRWDFGDGVTNTETNPVHTYLNSGVYTVSLTIDGPDGEDTLTRTNYIHVNDPVPPVASFSAAPLSGTRPLTVAFTDLSTGTVTSWDWTFGDGQTSMMPNPTHSYAMAGVYTVTLTASGPVGVDTLTRTHYITVTEQPPTADFTAQPVSGVLPLTVTFTNLSTGLIDSQLWSFGDGFTSSLTNPVHTYTAVGVYTASLSATGPGGSDARIQTNYITVTQSGVITPTTITPPTLSAPDQDIVVNFGEPVFTSTIQFEISPTISLAFNWSAESDYITISHTSFTWNVSHTLSVLSGGQTSTGKLVAPENFLFTYVPFRVLLPIVLK